LGTFSAVNVCTILFVMGEMKHYSMLAKEFTRGRRDQEAQTAA